MHSRSSIHLGELSLSIGLTVLGVIVIFHTGDISSVSGYSQIGPRVFPYLIGAGLFIFGGLLCWQAVSGGWRNQPKHQEGEAADWRAFAMLSAAIVFHMLSITWAGFILASTFLFMLIARGFGSRRIGRDFLAAAAVSSMAFFTFTMGLGLSLPPGPFGEL